MDPQIEKDVRDRLAQLPQVVRDAITSADTAARLRELSEKHKLHLDQWEILQNQVMLTLLAFQELEDLPQNIEKNVGVSHEIANQLADDVSHIVFEPIREELERQLEHPDAQAKVETGVEQMATQALAAREEAPVATVSPTLITPIAPVPETPEIKAIRAPISETYKTGKPAPRAKMSRAIHIANRRSDRRDRYSIALARWYTICMQFQVPQFIEVEDKIFGPLTFRQFIYIGGGAGLAYIIYRVLPIILALPVIAGVLGLAVALAFMQFNGRPFITAMENAFFFILRPRLYLWNNERKEAARTTKVDAAAQQAPEIYVPKLSESRLHELAWSLDIKERIAQGSADNDDRAQYDAMRPIKTAREALNK